MNESRSQLGVKKMITLKSHASFVDTTVSPRISLKYWDISAWNICYCFILFKERKKEGKKT
jgi:hypothetical protein